MCVHIAKKLGAEGAKKHSLTDRMEFSKEVYCISHRFLPFKIPLILKDAANTGNDAYVRVKNLKNRQKNKKLGLPV